MVEAPESFTVHIVDDDTGVRDSLALLLSLRGYRTAVFASAEDFLAALQPGAAGCVLADLRMPGMGGIELQGALRVRGCAMPVVIITGHGDVAAARAAFLADAVDFLEKPFDEAGPVAAVEQCVRREQARRGLEAEAGRRTEALGALTGREREIALLLAEGLHNREVAARLAISPRTVEVHKARIMEKLGARNLADLIRMAGRREA